MGGDDGGMKSRRRKMGLGKRGWGEIVCERERERVTRVERDCRWELVGSFLFKNIV